MVFMEYLEVKVDFLEILFVGKVVIVIENGKFNIKNMKKLRLIVDRLEICLR